MRGLTVRSRMHMRHEREQPPIAGLLEESEAGDEADERGLGIWLQEANHEQEDAGHEAQGVNQHLLAPERARVPVDGVAEGAARGAEDEVQEPEHGGPGPGAGLAELGEGLGVVGSQDRVDAEFGAEGAEVGDAEGEGRERQDGLCGALDRRLFDQFPARGGEEVIFLRLRLGVVALAAGGVELDGVVGEAGGGAGVDAWRYPFAVFARGGEEGVAHVEVALHFLRPRGPGTRGRVGAGQDHGQGGEGDQDEWDHERNAPGDVLGQVLVADERVEDGGHDEIGHAAACVAEASG